MPAAFLAAQLVQARHRGHHLVDGLAQETADAVAQHLGHRAAPHRDHRRAARQGLGHHQAERLGPIDREQQRRGAAQQLGFVLLVYFAHELNLIPAKNRLDLAVPVILVDRIDLGRDFERHTRTTRDLYRQIGPLFGRDTPQKNQIFAPSRLKRIIFDRYAVVHTAGPVQIERGQRLALRHADRNQRHMGIFAQNRRQDIQVKAPVQRRYERRIDKPGKW